MIAFAYYGAKNTHLKHLLPLLPECDHYVEPFAGSCAVIINRKPSPIETINDLNGDIVNFFRVLRDNPDQLVRALALTPYSRDEFVAAWAPSPDPVEQARRWYVRVQMDHSKAGRKIDKSWAVNKRYFPGEHSSSVNNFYTKVEGMGVIAQRIQHCQIENLPALSIISRYDHPGVLIYADPPYLPATRTSAKDYKHDMSLAEHIELAQALSDCKAKVAVSGYDDPEMEKMYPSCRWMKTVFPKKKVPMSRGKGRVTQECLWTNYNPDFTRKLYLFS